MFDHADVIRIVFDDTMTPYLMTGHEDVVLLRNVSVLTATLQI